MFLFEFVRKRKGGVLSYLYGDHLGSTSLTTNGSGGVTAFVRYKPFGVTRDFTAALPTNFGYTAQRFEANTGYIYDYGARMYDEYIGRFISADTVVPGAGNPQALNRYSYSYNNPLKYTDRSGHCPNDFCDFFGGLFAQIGYNSNPIPSGYVGSADALAVQPNESNSMLAGRLAGSVASGVLSYAEVAAGVAIGTGGGIGGALACAPTAGGGCVVAVGSVEVGAGLATEGVLTGGRAAVSGAETASILMAKADTSGSVPKNLDPKNLKGPFTKSQEYVRKSLGLSKEEFREAIHALKENVEGNPDMIFNTDTGDVYDQRSGDLVGNIHDYIP
jgi:RHS repeat-associated protein